MCLHYLNMPVVNKETWSGLILLYKNSVAHPTKLRSCIQAGSTGCFQTV